MKNANTIISADSGALISLATVPFVPVGMPVLFSLIGLRFTGFKLGSRMSFTENTRVLIADAATTLLLSVAVIATLLEGEHFAGVPVYWALL